MATTITGIVFNTDYNGSVKILVFAPNAGAIDIEFTAPDAALNNLGDPSSSSGGVTTYTYTGVTQYDNTLGAYSLWTNVFDINNDYTGTVHAKIQIESDPFVVNYSTKGVPYAQPGTKPQGMTITFQDCDNGQVKAWGGMENKVYDNAGAGSYQAALDTFFRMISPTLGTPIAPTHVVAITDIGGGSTWTESSLANVQQNGAKNAIFDLGTFNVGDTITFRAIGNSGEGAGDYLDGTFSVTCTATLPAITATDVEQTFDSLYTIPYPTTETNCTVTGVEIMSIPAGSTVEVGVTAYVVGDVIPIGEFTDTGTTYTGLREVTTGATQIGLGDGVAVRYNTGCGDTNTSTASRTITAESTSTVAVDDTATTTEGVAVVIDVLANDTLDCGGTVTLSIVPGSESNGTVTNVDNGGDITFTPTGGFVGTASFSYNILCDGVIQDVGSVTIAVDGSSVSDRSYVIEKDETLEEDAVEEGIVCAGGEYYELVEGSDVNGVATVDLGGLIYFTPNPGYDGPASFSYRIICGAYTLQTVTVNITVLGAATAVGDTAVTVRDTPVSIDVSPNDIIDCDNSPVTYVIDPLGLRNGTVVADDDQGNFTFTPSPGYTGTDAGFSYKIKCGDYEIAVAAVSITVNWADGINDAFTVGMNDTLSGSVVGNDTVVCDGATVYSLVPASEVNGTATVAANGDITFTPSLNYDGPASFQYKISCDGVALDTVTVNITVLGSATITGDSATTPANVSVWIDVSDNDTINCSNSATTYAVRANSAVKGTVVANGTAGIFIFTPGLNETGAGSFQYDVFCGTTLLGTGTVDVAITPNGSFSNDSYTVLARETLNGNVISNDTIICAGEITVALDAGSHGSLTGALIVHENGDFSFLSAPGWTGVGTFDYEVSCDGFLIGGGRVTINVIPVGSLLPDTFITEKNTPVSGNVSSNDEYNCGGDITFKVAVGSTYGGSLTDFNETTGAFTFTPLQNSLSPAGFQYSVYCDEVLLGTSSATINIYGATIVDDTNVTAMGVPVTGDVSLNDTVYCQGKIFFEYVPGSAVNGVLTSMSSSGVYNFTPEYGFAGECTFQYRVLCSGNNIGTGTVRIMAIDACCSDVINGSVSANGGSPYAGSVQGGSCKDFTKCESLTVFRDNEDGTFNYVDEKGESHPLYFGPMITTDANKPALGRNGQIIFVTDVLASDGSTGSWMGWQDSTSEWKALSLFA